MKTIVLQCERCKQTANVGAMLSGHDSFLLKGFCQTCKVIISVYLTFDNFRHRIGHETEVHVRLVATAERPIAAHA